MPVNVNDRLSKTTREIQGLEDVLRNSVLPDLKGKAGNLVPILVNCRLNETNQRKAAPIWCGWVEDPPSTFDPIPGDHLSPVYQRAYHNSDRVQRVDYSVPDHIQDEKLPDPRPNPHYDAPLKQDSSTGFTWRRYICIKADGKRAGTLTVGFQQTPADEAAVETALRNWAKGYGNDELVKFLENNFRLGGAPHP